MIAADALLNAVVSLEPDESLRIRKLEGKWEATVEIPLVPTLVITSITLEGLCNLILERNQ